MYNLTSPGQKIPKILREPPPATVDRKNTFAKWFLSCEGSEMGALGSFMCMEWALAGRGSCFMVAEREQNKALRQL